MSYQRLVAEHDEIDVAARQIEHLLTGDEPAGVVVSTRLSELALLVADHLRNEDQSVYQPLIKRQDKPRSEALLNLELHLEDLRHDWLQYLADWTPECVKADFDTFRSDTTQMMSRLRARVKIETDLIYPLALKHGSIRLKHAVR